MLTTSNHFRPAKLASLAGIALAAASVLAQPSQRSVAAWGINGSGQTDVPANLKNIVRVFSGFGHSVALRNDGTLLAWGDNRFGQCNIPADATNVVEVACGSSFTLARRADGWLRIWGANSAVLGNVLTIPFGAGFTPSSGISAGYSMCANIGTGGSVRVWGSPASGGIIQSTLSSSGVKAVAVGDDHVVALRSDGTVVSWGSLSRPWPGLTNVPPDLSNVVAVAAGAYHTLALRADGTLASWGADAYAPFAPPADLTNVIAIAASGYQSMALTADGRMRVWGVGPTGQALEQRLQVPNGLSNIVSIVSGSAYALALVVNTPPVVTQPPRSRAVPEGWPVTFKTTVAGEPPISLQWQFNGTNLPAATNASLMISNVSLANTGAYRVIASNALGVVTSSVAPLRLGTLLAAGENSYEQNFIPAGVTNANSMAIGRQEGIVVDSGVVKTWGNTPADGFSAIGTIADAWCAGGGDVTGNFVIQSNGQLVVWGNPFLPPVPASFSNVVGAALDTRFMVAVRVDGNVVAAGDSFSPTNLPAVLSNVVVVAAYGGSAFALRSDGSIVAWSSYASSQTNVPVSLTNAVAIGCGSFETYALRDDGTVVTWNSSGALLPVAGVSNAVAMAVGGLHGLALRNDGSVFGWGSDQYGQIGFAQSVSNVQAVAAGGSTSLVKLGNGTPFITLNPFSRTVAAGEAFKLTTFAVGQPSLSYQWQRNGDDLPAETNASLLVAAATLADAGAYRCIITNTLGAVASAVATITIQSGVPPRFDLLHVPPLLVSNGFQVKVNDLSGLGPLVIYASSNLVDWLPIFTNPANPGSVLFVDPATTNLSQRFYRASEER